MSFTVRFYRDANLSDTVKYREPYSGLGTAIPFTCQNNNFSNQNVLSDNAVEICFLPYLGQLNYDYFTAMTHLEIIYDKSETALYPNLRIIAKIIDVEYLNDSNVRVHYSIDAYMSARASGLITNMVGYCERTHLDYAATQSFINLAPEPFSPQDIMRSDTYTTEAMNDAAEAFEGITMANGNINFGNCTTILTVSVKVVEYLGLTPFAEPSTTFPIRLQSRDDLNFTSNDVTHHSGGMYRGTPLKFATPANAKAFINRILSGCGFITVMGAGGWDNNTVRNQYVVNNTSGAGNVYITEKNIENELDTECISLITAADIYNMYIIPTNFANYGTTQYTSFGNTISTLPNVSSMHGLGAEDNTKSKLLAYPYFYSKIVTANGDCFTIYPQVHNQRSGVWSNLSQIILDLKYVGGDTARLMARIPASLATSNPYSNQTVGEWFTVRSYPAITLSIDNSYNPQIQKEIAQTRSLSAMFANAIGSAQLSNPIRQGYVDTVSGNNQDNPNRSYFNKALNAIGGYLVNPNVTDGGRSLFKNTAGQEVVNANRTANAGNFLTSESAYISGNDFLGQLNTPWFTVWSCGASNGEVFTFCRYLDQFGSACNCILNPLSNAGTILGGGASVTSYNGRTFYKFTYIDVIGVMPSTWKEKIKELFESGVYLINSAT